MPHASRQVLCSCRATQLEICLLSSSTLYLASLRGSSLAYMAILESLLEFDTTILNCNSHTELSV